MPFLVTQGVHAVNDPPEQFNVTLLAQELGKLPPGIPPMGKLSSNGTIVPIEQYRDELYEKIRQLDQKSLYSLCMSIDDANPMIRKNIALALNALSSSWYERSRARLDIQNCLPILIAALQDTDSEVRGWSAQAIGNIGPTASIAVPALIHLLKTSDEGGRNSACIALGEIGPSAQQALPALQAALSDPSTDVKGFARRAIQMIQHDK